MDVPDEKKRAFEATSYVVDPEPGVLERPLTLRIGEPSPELDSLLEKAGMQRWAYITAWNPRATPVSKEENAELEAKLDRRLEALGFVHGKTVLEGRGVGDTPGWIPEESRMILGMTRSLATRVCQEFEQAAYVAGVKGEGPELVGVPLDDDGPVRGRASGRCG